MTQQDELLDLVNNKDEVISTIWRSEYDRLETEDLGYIRAVELLIQNENGKLWIPKRTSTKKIAPNGLDYSAGGHVSSGETYEEAMLKEISEELNLDLEKEDLELLGTLGPDQYRYFRKVYRYKSNETPQFNPHDFVSASWLSVDDIIAAIDAGTPAKLSIKPTLEKLRASLEV